jgi:ArsR family transcriptional regulator, cadmium/lead-responsive transcriptional repressor
VRERQYSNSCIVKPVQGTKTRLDALQRVGRALSDPTRARMLLLIADGACYPADLAEVLGTTRANISNHLTCLRGCGLVRALREGRNVRYELADGRLAAILHELSDVAVADHCDTCDGRTRTTK